MAPHGGKCCSAPKELVASDSNIEEVGATTAPAAAGHEPQDIPEDGLSDGDTKFGVVENDKIEAGAVTLVTPLYENPTEHDGITIHNT